MKKKYKMYKTSSYWLTTGEIADVGILNIVEPCGNFFFFKQPKYIIFQEKEANARPAT